MGEKGVVSEVPPAARVISHDIGGARDVVMEGHIAVVPLMQGIEAEQVGTGRTCRGRAFSRPGKGGLIVASKPEGALGHGVRVGKDGFVGNGTGKFQVGNGKRPSAIVTRDQFTLDGKGKGRTPDVCGGANKPDTTHATLAGITGARCVSGGGWHEFAEAGGTRCQVIGQGTEVAQTMVDVASEANAVVGSAPAQGILEMREQAT